MFFVIKIIPKGEMIMSITRETLPMLGFGLMRLPLLPTGKVDIEETKAMVDIYMQSGMNYFDTAYGYHEGESELVVKEAISSRYPREAFILASKLPIWSVKEAADVPKIFNHQLEKCGVDYFDYYLLHALNRERSDLCEQFGAYEFAKEMKKQGKIKHFGFSFHGKAECLEHILANHPEVEFVQLQLNYFDWMGDYRAHYDITRKYGKPIIIMEPVRGGALAKLPSSVEEIFKEINPNVSNASWAMRWAADLDGVVNILSGMSNMEQLCDNIATLKPPAPLNADERNAIDKAAQTLTSMPQIPCTACNYCKNCPEGVPIADILDMYNEFQTKGRSMFNLNKRHKEMQGKTALDCTSCGVCSPICPQGIDIPAGIKQVKELLS